MYAVLSVHEVHYTKMMGSSSGASALRGVQMSTVARMSWPNFVVVFVNFCRRIPVRVYYNRLPIIRHCLDRRGASVSVLEPFSHLQYRHWPQCYSRVGINIAEAIRKRLQNTITSGHNIVKWRIAITWDGDVLPRFRSVFFASADVAASLLSRPPRF